MVAKKIRVRIPPSPTGNLHVGTARTALFNELFARHDGGELVVRSEDTDAARSKPEFEKNILDGLQWLGLEWQEGPDKGGAYGPYRQSERTDIYIQALKKLLVEKKAYYCECPAGEKNCPCASKNLDNPALPIRLHVDAQEISFEDHVRGRVTTHTDTFGGSFIIARSLQAPLYHLAVVVDDALMEITHVIRGEDHISNTPKHILLQRALGYSQPEYAHLPLLVDDQRKKLSKRKHNTDLLSYRDQGYLAETMLNYLALLGWGAQNDQEFFTHEELIREFSLDRIQKGSAVFSIAKLNSMNQHYIRQLSIDELFERTRPFLEKAQTNLEDTKLVKAALATEQQRITTLSELPNAIGFFLTTEKLDYPAERLMWKKSTKEKTRARLEELMKYIDSLADSDFTEAILKEKIMSWMDSQQLDRGETLWPLRVALTGHENSPGPFEVAAVLGKQETSRRIRDAHDTLSV